MQFISVLSNSIHWLSTYSIWIIYLIHFIPITYVIHIHVYSTQKIRCGLILFWYVKQNAWILYWYKKLWKTGSDAVAFLSSFHLLLPVEIECLRKTMYKIKNIFLYGNYQNFSFSVTIKRCWQEFFRYSVKIWITLYRTETGNVIIF